jgi:hypothetical protein
LLTGGIAEQENINSKKRKGKEKNVDQGDEAEDATPSTSSGTSNQFLLCI